MVRWGQSAPPVYAALVAPSEPSRRLRGNGPSTSRTVSSAGLQEGHDRRRGVGGFRLPTHDCTRPYRVVRSRRICLRAGRAVLFDEIRYFFHHERRHLVVRRGRPEARQRCNQENLGSEGRRRALHAPVNTLHANWASVMAALAWSLKRGSRSGSLSPPAGGRDMRRSNGSCCAWTSGPSSGRSSMCPARS